MFVKSTDNRQVDKTTTTTTTSKQSVVLVDIYIDIYQFMLFPIFIEKKQSFR